MIMLSLAFLCSALAVPIQDGRHDGVMPVADVTGLVQAGDAHPAVPVVMTDSSVSMGAHTVEITSLSKQQLLAKEKLSKMMEPLSNDLSAREERVQQLKAEAEQPLVEGLARLETDIKSTTDRISAARVDLVDLEEQKKRLEALKVDAHAVIDNSVQARANLTRRCDAQQGIIERRITTLRADLEVLSSLATWLDTVSTEWGDPTIASHFVSLVGQLAKDSELEQVALLSSNPNTAVEAEHTSVVGKVDACIKEIRELVEGLHGAHANSISQCAKEGIKLDEKIAEAKATLLKSANMEATMVKSRLRLSDQLTGDTNTLQWQEAQRDQTKIAIENLHKRWEAEVGLLGSIRSLHTALKDELTRMI